MEQHQLFREILEGLHDLPAMLTATVITVKGATPREVGAKMVIRSDGKFLGTIGGGCGEAEVWEEAMKTMKGILPSHPLTVDLTLSPETGSPKICGGTMEIFLDLWLPSHLSLLESLLKGTAEGREQVLATVISSSYSTGSPSEGLNAGGKLLAGPFVSGTTGHQEMDRLVESEATLRIQEGKSLVKEFTGSWGSSRIFLELVPTPPELVIVGAGHIAQPLASIGKLLDFRVTVIDDRPAMAIKERFPGADAVLQWDLFTPLSEMVHLTRRTYFILVTRGHKYDEIALRQILDSPVPYIGMIGSRRRVRAVFNDLKKDGFPTELLKKVFAPVGLDIGAETPAEIALCIVAEIVDLRRGGKGQHLALKKS